MKRKLFINLDDEETHIITNGIKIKPVYYTDEFMAALFIIDDNVPAHKHINTQFGIVLKGEALFRIGQKEKILKKNIFYYVPSNIEHEVKVLKGPLYALDIFIPPREDYKKYFNE